VRFETAPGEQAQADFAHFGTISHQGRDQRLYAFLMTLGWSRMLFVCFSLSCDWVAFLRGHLAAFAYFGGTPRSVLHDNLKSAVLDRAGGQVRFHPRYLDFADYYGFTPRACKPYRAQTKGKVERAVQYVRGNFWPGLHHSGLDNLNAQAQVWLDSIANVRIHATTGVSPLSRLEAEGLAPFDTRPPYEVTSMLVRQASRDGWVRYGGSGYAVPLAHAGQTLLVQLNADGQLVLSTPVGEVVARHALAVAAGQQVGQPTPLPAEAAQQAAPLPAAPAPARPLTAAPEVPVRALSEYDVLLEGI
jgi:hypothetical protein